MKLLKDNELQERRKVMRAPPVQVQEKIVEEVESMERELRNAMNGCISRLEKYGACGRVTLELKIERTDGPSGPIDMELDRTIKMGFRGPLAT